MKTQLSILVKNESLLSRAYSFLWFINIFKKMSVNVWIDQDPDRVKTPTHVLKANQDPYEFDLAPGEHIVYFSDPRAGGKAAIRAVTGALVEPASPAAQAVPCWRELRSARISVRAIPWASAMLPFFCRKGTSSRFPRNPQEKAA